MATSEEEGVLPAAVSWQGSMSVATGGLTTVGSDGARAGFG